MQSIKMNNNRKTSKVSSRIHSQERKNNGPTSSGLPSTMLYCLPRLLDQTQWGFIKNLGEQKPVVQTIAGTYYKDFQPYKTASPFERRVTAMQWHPKYPNVIAAGSKGGEIILWNFEKNSSDIVIPGVGPGGSITAMKFQKEDTSFMYTASITGRVMLQDFNGRETKTFLDTRTLENWFTALDVDFKSNSLITGDCKGQVYLLNSTNGEPIWNKCKKLHKGKVSDIQFNFRNQNLFVTSSIDHTVKIWDLRKISDQKSALHVMPHEKAVSTAKFSMTDGTGLVTSDQHSQIKLFRAPFWSEEQMTIRHPHRQFQHITPIKVSWHPLVDLLVIGRYPDDSVKKNDHRCIDFYDANTGSSIYQMRDAGVPGIVSLNEFNSTAESLASASGFQLVIWKSQAEKEQRILELIKSGDALPKPTKKRTKPRSNGPSKVTRASRTK